MRTMTEMPMIFFEADPPGGGGGDTPPTPPANPNTPPPAGGAPPVPPADPATPPDPGVKDGDGPKGAPEKYEAFTVPEGFALDTEYMDKEVLPLFKELGLPQESAQKLVSRLAERELAGQAAREAAAVESFNKTVEGWRAENAKNPQMVKDASDAMALLASPELKAALEPLGMGDHPAVIGFFAKLKGMMNEDRFVQGAGGGGKKPFYNNSPGLKQ